MTQVLGGAATDSDTRRLDRRVAVVSGAASGIGRAIALRLAAEGAQVICGDVRRQPLPGGLDPEEPTDSVITAAGGQATFASWDITDAAQAFAVFDTARRAFGRVDIVVANAGVALGAKPLPEEEPELWESQLKVNLTGTWNTVRAGLRALIDQRDGGRIVAMSSVAGLLGFKGLGSGYGVTKAGIIELTRQAAVEGAPYGITANAVCPGFVRTAINPITWQTVDAVERYAALHPLGRLGEPDDVAAGVAFLASDDAAWITGVVLPIDGGMTCV